MSSSSPLNRHVSGAARQLQVSTASMMGETVDHHFLPQFYLKGFLDAHVEPRHEPHVWVRDVASKRIRRRAPKNVARAPGFYALEDSADENVIEARLAAQESDAAKELREFLRLPLVDRSEFPPHLTRFVSMLAARGPWLRRMADQNWGRYLLEDAESLLVTQGAGEVEVADPITDVRRRLQLRDALPEIKAGRVVVKATRNQQLQMMVQQADWFEQQHFPRLHWMFVDVGAPMFVTSDRPVVWSAPDGGGLDQPGALLVRGADVTIPLSASVALYGRNGPTPASIPVEQINSRTVRAAEQFVIAANLAALVRATGPE